ncbi:hypothetical protein EIN_136580 [Entamoeba invadens IP1]|uniref:Leucine rich repeat containing protein BspA family protein n=1 Tax=Entamoeba invadens IP1 TaxID=370355 RepID=A0A0A1U353_ENTIV|nr:hypothetical protein EIN_136580 [Entamoeba invadens IP1]ELP85984.1 hypothetical protein EIN_136580 [Entamoeba invadens IP1]|eukprot:XP_004185330.1 hypothetical protein EIN_136580 [Entamoeba invadens IP1]
MCVQLDRYSMMIVSKYFMCLSDFKNMVFVCKKFQEIPEMFHYNPISILFKTQKYFPNVETLHLYNEKDKFLSKYKQYYVHYPIPLHKYFEINKCRRVICPFKTYSMCQDKGFFYKDANIFLDKAFAKHTLKTNEMDCTNYIKFGVSCFESNDLLTAITLSSNLYEIPDKCFYMCANLKEIDLKHIRMFGEFCFCGCDSLSAITLGTNIIKSDKTAFEDVTSIQNVTAPGVTSVDLYITVSSSKAFTNIKHKTVITKFDKNVLPDLLSDEIHRDAFRNKGGLSDINLATTVTVIEDCAFNACDIKRLDLSNVISFGSQYDMNFLTAITLNKNIQISNLYDYIGLKKIDVIDTRKINGIAACWMKEMLDEKSLEVDKFYYTQKDGIVFKGKFPPNCKNITAIFACSTFAEYKHEEIVIPEGVQSIDINAFENNDKLRKLVFPASIIFHDEMVDYDNFKFSHSNIEELCIRPQPNLIITDCPKLTSVTFIDQNITNRCIFYKCFNVKNIEFLNMPMNFVFRGNIDFTIYDVLKNRYNFEGDVVLYLINPKLIDNNGVLKIPDEVNIIEVSAIESPNLIEVWLGKKINMINTCAFYRCSNLECAKNMKKSVDIRCNAFYKVGKTFTIEYVD